MEKQYYVQQLNKWEKQAYDAMLRGCTALATSCRVPRLQTLGEVYYKLKLDHPELFYVQDYSYSYTDTSEYVEFFPSYSFEKSKIEEQRRALEARLTKLLRPVLEKNELEKEKFIHEFILQNVKYDKLKKDYSHQVTGPLFHSIGVCEGIAKTVKLLCDRLGLGCIVVICEADHEHGGKYRHAWNLVRQQGTWYHLDATFNNSLGRYGALRYDYYNLDDARIFRDHRHSIYPIPACSDGGGFYYKKNGLSFTKYEDAEKRIRQCLKKKQPLFVFHWRGGFLTREVLLELLRLAALAGKEAGKTVDCSVNWPQAVVQLRFSDDGAAEIETEEADEGEAFLDEK